MNCENCKTEHSDQTSVCPTCAFPITGNIETQRAYRNRVGDIRHAFIRQSRIKAFIRTIAIAMLILGVPIALTNFGGNRIYGFIYVILGLIYLLSPKVNKDQNPLFYLGLGGFYFFHTLLELVLGILPPSYISMGFNRFGEEVVVTNIFLAALPYAYIVARLSLVVIFYFVYRSDKMIEDHPKESDFIRKFRL